MIAAIAQVTRKQPTKQTWGFAFSQLSVVFYITLRQPPPLLSLLTSRSSPTDPNRPGLQTRIKCNFWLFARSTLHLPDKGWTSVAEGVSAQQMLMLKLESIRKPFQCIIDPNPKLLMMFLHLKTIWEKTWKMTQATKIQVTTLSTFAFSSSMAKNIAIIAENMNYSNKSIVLCSLTT